MDNIKHKGIIIVMGLWIVEKFGLLGPLLFVLCILMLVDYFSGMLAAKKACNTEQISSPSINF